MTEDQMLELKDRLTTKYRNEPWLSSTGIAKEGVRVSINMKHMSQSHYIALLMEASREGFHVKNTGLQFILNT